jgi:hypothetical protein
MGDTQEDKSQMNGTGVPYITESNSERKPRSSVFLQMDKLRRLRQERHDIYLCEVEILTGLRKSQNAKLRELNEIKSKVTLNKQSQRGPRTSKKAIMEMTAEDDLKKV